MEIEWDFKAEAKRWRKRYEEASGKYTDALEACRAVVEWNNRTFGEGNTGREKFIHLCKHVVEKEDDGKEDR